MTFLSEFIDGTASVGDVDAHVARWRKLKGKAKCDLPGFLGMTEAEYGQFAWNQTTLYEIAAKRRAKGRKQ